MHVVFACEADLGQLRLAERDQVLVGERPQSVALEAEVFEAEAGELLVGHHLRRPRAEVLDAADLDARLVDVDPVVGEQIRLVRRSAPR